MKSLKKEWFFVLAALSSIVIACDVSFDNNDKINRNNPPFMNFYHINWNGEVDKTIAKNIDAVENTTRSNASGPTIRSHKYNADFPGIFFIWDFRQNDSGYLKILAGLFNLYESFTLTSKESNTYWDFVIKPQAGQDITEDGCFIFFLPRARNNRDINMVFVSKFEKHGNDEPPVDKPPIDEPPVDKPSGNIIWTTITNPVVSFSTSDIGYGNGRFIAVSWSNIMMYSDDGETWKSLTNTALPGYAIESITYGNGIFVVTARARMAYSEDGLNWTAIVNTGIGDNWIKTVHFANGRFVAGGEKGRMAYSDDGINWIPVKNSTFTNNITSISYGGGRFVAGGFNGRMAYSDDGITWTAVNESTFKILANQNAYFHMAIRDISYGDERFVAVGDYGWIAYSDDGITWTATSSTLDNWLNSIETISYGNGIFIAGGSRANDVDGFMLYSEDGITWARITDFTSTDFSVRAIAYGSGRFVVGWGLGGAGHTWFTYSNILESNDIPKDEEPVFEP